MGEVMSTAGGTLDRREVVASLLHDRKDLLVVAGLGSSAYDLMAAGDHDGNYYLWGAMGSALTMGLGLATAQPGKTVLVLTGDGEALMGLGALATAALRRPRNLTVAVLDNGHYGETGMQQSHAGRGIELDRVAASCGFDWTARVTDMAGVAELRREMQARDGLKFATVKIAASDLPRVLPPRDGALLKTRFRAALGLAPI